MSDEVCVIHAEVRIIIRVHREVGFVNHNVLDLLVCFSDARVGYPVVIALVEVLKMDVVVIRIFVFRFSCNIIYNKIRKRRKKEYASKEGSYL